MDSEKQNRCVSPYVFPGFPKRSAINITLAMNTGRRDIPECITLVTDVVCDLFNVTHRDLSMKDGTKGARKRFRAWPRMIAMHLLRDRFGTPVVKIAKAYNRRDHGSASTADKRCREILENPATDPKMYSMIVEARIAVNKKIDQLRMNELEKPGIISSFVDGNIDPDMMDIEKENRMLRKRIYEIEQNYLKLKNNG